jgi:hypothetical protein
VTPQAAAELERQILAVLLRETSPGRRVFDDRVLADAIPACLLQLGSIADPTQLPEASRQLVFNYLERAGVTRAESQAAADEALQQYQKAHPLPLDLQKELDRVLRDALSSTATPTPDAARLLGQPRVVLPGPPPAGATRVGPNARAELLARTPRPKKEDG